MKYRSRAEIISTVLQAVKKGSTKTKIMYDAYLSYTQLKEYLKYLEENQLISYDSKDHIYNITENGKKFLKAFDEITNLISPNSGKEIKNFII